MEISPLVPQAIGGEHGFGDAKRIETCVGWYRMLQLSLASRTLKLTTATSFEMVTPATTPSLLRSLRRASPTAPPIACGTRGEIL